jgi:hypothetical protein
VSRSIHSSLLIVGSILGGIGAFAQDSQDTKTEFAFMAGVIAASGSTTEGVSTQYDWAENATAGWRPSFTAAFQMEIYNPEQSGARFKTGLTFYNNELTFEEFTVGLDYTMDVKSMRLEVPVMIAYPFPESKAGLYLQGGAGLNFNLKFDDHLVVVVPPSTIYRESEELDGNVLSLNVMGGAGVQFPVSSRALRVEFSFGWNPFIVQSKTEWPRVSIIALGLTAGLVL